jgi:hypothetical protein
VGHCHRHGGVANRYNTIDRFRRRLYTCICDRPRNYDRNLPSRYGRIAEPERVANYLIYD